MNQPYPIGTKVVLKSNCIAFAIRGSIESEVWPGYYFYFLKNCGQQQFDTDDFILYKPKPQFKIGDWVEIVYPISIYNGKKFKIKGKSDTSEQFLLDQGSRSYYYFATNLILCDPPKPKFPIGTEVFKKGLGNITCRIVDYCPQEKFPYKISYGTFCSVALEEELTTYLILPLTLEERVVKLEKVVGI